MSNEIQKIQLWSVNDAGDGKTSVSSITSLNNTETEHKLEGLLTQSPHLLVPGLTLVGRQLPTAGGPLDLLGVSEDGELIVFELKRGTLTRDAVAQVLD